MPGIKADLASAIPEASALVSKVMALFCLTQGGLHPQSINIENFINATFGDVKKAAESHVAATKAKALEDYRAIDQWQQRIEDRKEAKAQGKVPGNNHDIVTEPS